MRRRGHGVVLDPEESHGLPKASLGNFETNDEWLRAIEAFLRGDLSNVPTLDLSTFCKRPVHDNARARWEKAGL
jgi:hypothetical protein